MEEGAQREGVRRNEKIIKEVVNFQPEVIFLNGREYINTTLVKKGVEGSAGGRAGEKTELFNADLFQLLYEDDDFFLTLSFGRVLSTA